MDNDTRDNEDVLYHLEKEVRINVTDVENGADKSGGEVVLKTRRRLAKRLLVALYNFTYKTVFKLFLNSFNHLHGLLNHLTDFQAHRMNFLSGSTQHTKLATKEHVTIFSLRTLSDIT